ncbi:hypothetical protein DFH06DRAFT_1288595 [Mycena polygramma]|nr:hypothetical protein DFH06DRAFT_1288595 [Mycena polygramma]
MCLKFSWGLTVNHQDRESTGVEYYYTIVSYEKPEGKRATGGREKGLSDPTGIIRPIGTDSSRFKRRLSSGPLGGPAILSRFGAARIYLAAPFKIHNALRAPLLVAGPQDPFTYKINQLQFQPRRTSNNQAVSFIENSLKARSFELDATTFKLAPGSTRAGGVQEDGGGQDYNMRGFGGPDVWLWVVTREDAVMIEANCIFLDSEMCGYARTSPTACLGSDQMGIFFGRPGP